MAVTLFKPDGVLMIKNLDIPDEVKRQFLEALEVSEDVYSEDLGPGDIAEWDSLANVRFIQAVEARFELSFDVSDMFAIETVADVIAMVRRYRDE
jgi:acyl carrier protein